jgi:hypothetical protein
MAAIVESYSGGAFNKGGFCMALVARAQNNPK